MDVPDELIEAAGDTVDSKSQWSAHCPNGRLYTWDLHSHRSFGVAGFRKWAARCISKQGLPVRFQWRRMGTREELLADETIWDDEPDDHGESDNAIPSFSDLLPKNGQMNLGGAVSTSNAERAVKLLIDNPEAIKTGFQAFGDLFRTIFDRDPDDLKAKQHTKDVAAASAAAVTSKLAEMLGDKGYEVGEDGEVRDPEGQIVTDEESVIEPTFSVVEPDEDEEHQEVGHGGIKVGT